MLPLLSKAQIIQAPDLPVETVDVPEWGGSVHVRAMTGSDRNAYDLSNYRVEDGKYIPDPQRLKLKLVALTLVNGTGECMFSLDELEDLGKKSAAAIERIYEVSARLNGMGAKAVEDAIKNSVAEDSALSTSA